MIRNSRRPDAALRARIPVDAEVELFTSDRVNRCVNFRVTAASITVLVRLGDTDHLNTRS
jgi:hypothetical protein